jgi:hypothetical protein
MNQSDPSFQKSVLESLYAARVNWSVIFKSNLKFCIGKFEAYTPFIAVPDLKSGLFIIRGADLAKYGQVANLIINRHITNFIAAGGESVQFYQMEAPIIKEYTNLDDLVNDGWLLDHHIS